MERLYRKKEDCCGCGACADACPQNAIRMAADREGFFYPEIDGARCTDCGRCEAVCPLQTPRSAGEASRQYYGAQAKDTALRSASSSGGMFAVLAEFVLRRQGVVFGAAYDASMRVAHREIAQLEDLDAVKRTKYVQSSFAGVYRQAAARLREDRWVLFCGTPCQTEGLRLFLGRPHPKLILVDLVCYGAPSPGVWADYVRYLEAKHGGKLTDFSFRDKRGRDNGHTCAYVVGGREYAGPLAADAYCGMYFDDLTLRPACHACKFCTTARGSDFTLGDFWGVERVKPEADDGMGTSLVIVHTEQARRVWEAVRGGVDGFACTEKEVLQPRLEAPTPKARGRGMWMALYRLLPFPLFLSLRQSVRRLPRFLRRGKGG